MKSSQWLGSNDIARKIVPNVGNCNWKHPVAHGNKSCQTNNESFGRRRTSTGWNVSDRMNRSRQIARSCVIEAAERQNANLNCIDLAAWSQCKQQAMRTWCGPRVADWWLTWPRHSEQIAGGTTGTLGCQPTSHNHNYVDLKQATRRGTVMQ